MGHSVLGDLESFLQPQEPSSHQGCLSPSKFSAQHTIHPWQRAGRGC